MSVRLRVPCRGHQTHYRDDALQQTAITCSSVNGVGARLGIRREREAPDEQPTKNLPRDLRLPAKHPAPLSESGAQLVADAVAPLRRAAEAVGADIGRLST
jgi:hypothetical protein